jgi:hypothetical protein
MFFSENTNALTIEFLEKHVDKINWYNIIMDGLYSVVEPPTALLIRILLFLYILDTSCKFFKILLLINNIVIKNNVNIFNINN